MLTPFRADLLCAGAAFAIVWKHRTPRLEKLCRNRAWVGFLAGFGGLALAQLWPLLRLSANSRTGNALDYSLSVLGSFSLLAWTLADRGWLHALLVWRPMRFIGQISYTMYLVHLIPIYLLRRHTDSDVIVALVSLPVTLIYSTLSWFLMEKPLISFAARKVPGHPRTRSAALAK
jgi:peptidoglycan/LPS O-acetylase OafA/YrhL